MGKSLVSCFFETQCICMQKIYFVYQRMHVWSVNKICYMYCTIMDYTSILWKWDVAK